MIEDPYRRFAGFYDRLFEPINQGLRLLGLRMFPPKPGMKVLDVGCGTGTHLHVYRRFGCELYGIDTSPSMLGIADARLGDDADLRLADATEIPFENDMFDLVVCMLVLHEMDRGSRMSAIGEFKRVIKPDGRMLTIDFHAGPARPLRGWWTKLIILISEVAAGRRHFRNYRHFMSIGGLPSLIDDGQLVVEKRKVVAGGTIALYLLRRAHP